MNSRNVKVAYVTFGCLCLISAVYAENDDKIYTSIYKEIIGVRREWKHPARSNGAYYDLAILELGKFKFSSYSMLHINLFASNTI